MKITKVASATKPFSPENVELRESKVGDLLKAEQIAGKAEGLGFMLALLSQVGTFDGQTLPPEELHRLSSTDFLDLSKELELSGTAISPATSSTLLEKGSSESPAS